MLLPQPSNTRVTTGLAFSGDAPSLNMNKGRCLNISLLLPTGLCYSVRIPRALLLAAIRSSTALSTSTKKSSVPPKSIKTISPSNGLEAPQVLHSKLLSHSRELQAEVHRAVLLKMCQVRKNHPTQLKDCHLILILNRSSQPLAARQPLEPSFLM